MHDKNRPRKDVEQSKYLSSDGTERPHVPVKRDQPFRPGNSHLVDKPFHADEFEIHSPTQGDTTASFAQGWYITSLQD